MSRPSIPDQLYDRIRSSAGHPAQRLQLPVEHFRSLPLPTLRWGAPAYASFAAPAVRTPGLPLRLGTPDRWWLVDADRVELAAYGLTAATKPIDHYKRS
jgi:hypothetical protein